MNILEKIVADKRKEIDLKKSLITVAQLEASVMMERTSVSLAEVLRKSNSGIIAEHKRRSPSKSVINHNLSVQDVAKGYTDAGVCGISVLTDGKYFWRLFGRFGTCQGFNQHPTFAKRVHHR